MEIKYNDWITVNIFINRKLKKETDKGILFSIPFNKGLSVWISKKCIHGSRNDLFLGVGIKSTDEYNIWSYDNQKNILKKKFEKDIF